MQIGAKSDYGRNVGSLSQFVSLTLPACRCVGAIPPLKVEALDSEAEALRQKNLPLWRVISGALLKAPV